jgi:hypothetical protein
MSLLTSLWWTKVLARSRGAWAGAASLLNAQGAALDDLALEALLGSIGLLCGDHLDESEATRLLGVWIKHDLALLDLTILLEQASDLGLGETWVDAGDEQVRSRVHGAIVLRRRSTVVLWATGWAVSVRIDALLTGMRNLPRIDVAIANWGSRAATWAVVAARAWRGATVAFVTWRLVC